MCVLSLRHLPAPNRLLQKGLGGRGKAGFACKRYGQTMPSLQCLTISTDGGGLFQWPRSTGGTEGGMLHILHTEKAYQQETLSLKDRRVLLGINHLKTAFHVLQKCIWKSQTRTCTDCKRHETTTVQGY
jgi:hypothetical protein